MRQDVTNPFNNANAPAPNLTDDFTDRLLAIDPDLDSFLYSSESYDATILIALAALAAGSTDGVDIASKLQEVSGGSGDGETCTDFASCAQIIADGGIVDYDGPSGPITLNDAGDPTEATIGIFEYGDDNTYAGNRLN